jgi:hypothetical protein
VSGPFLPLPFRFSRRTGFGIEPNALARALASRQARGEALLDLTESNPTRAGFLLPRDLVQALGAAEVARYEPHPLGLIAAREAVARDSTVRGVRIDPERIALTASSSESYAYLFKVLCDPGDEVLTPRPSYPLFEYLARVEGVNARSYPLDFDGEWHLSVDRIESLLSERTRAVVVVHPNNPTGSFLSTSEAHALISFSARRGVAIIADEVFADFVFEGPARPSRLPPVGPGASHRAVSLAGLSSGSGALVFSLGGLSKSCLAPQLKLGWIAMGGAEELVAAARSRLELVADTYLSVGTPVQVAAASILARREELQRPARARLARNLGTLRSTIGARPELSLLPVEGGWTAVIRCPATRTDEDRALAALDRGVLVHPGHFFDFDPRQGEFLVVSLLVEPSVFAEALPALMEAAAA